MIRTHSLAWMTAISLLTVHNIFGQRLNDEVLRRYKAVTVCVSDNKHSPVVLGSGLLVDVQENVAIVVTTAQGMEKRKRCYCVFNSGSAEETSFEASLLDKNDESNLAFLKLTGDKFPLPVQVRTEELIQETVPVFIFGFPESLTLKVDDSKHPPPINISKAAISSIRRDQGGRITSLLIDRGFDPGNAGAPVATEAGEFVGIVSGEVKGTPFSSVVTAGQLLSARSQQTADKPSRDTSKGRP